MERATGLRPVTIVACLAVAGCAGGGAGVTTPAPVARATATASPGAADPSVGSRTADVTFAFRIPARDAASSAARRRPAFVSSATQGVLVQAYASPEASGAAPVATFAIDVSPASKACPAVAAGAARTCSFILPLAGGTYDFVDTLYDAAPANGAFASALVLGVGRTTQSIALYTTNTVTVSIGGRVASVVLGPVRDVAVNTAPASYALAVTALDADKVPIVAGSADPYDNPVTIAASDSGAHTTLSLNGGAPSASVVTTQSADTIAVAYDGAGPPGYFAMFAASATGIPTSAAGFDSFSATLALVSFLGVAQTQTETIVEPHNIAPFTVTPAAACANVTTAGPLSGTGSTETFTLASGTMAGTCYVTAASETGTTSVPLKVVNLVPAVVTIPQRKLYAANRTTATIQAFDVANGGALVQTIGGPTTMLQGPTGIARDSAGNLFVADAISGILAFPPDASGDAAPLPALGIPSGSSHSFVLPESVAVDRAGDVFVLPLVGQSAIVFAAGHKPSDAPVRYLGINCQAVTVAAAAIAVDGSGQAYISVGEVSNGPNAGANIPVGINVYTAGSSSFCSAPPARFVAVPLTKVMSTQSSFPSGQLAVDLAGDVYETDPAGTSFFEYGPTAVGAAMPLRVGTGLSSPGGIAVANDGTVYVVTHPTSGSTTSTAIAVFPPGATTPASTFPVASGNVQMSLAL